MIARAYLPMWELMWERPSGPKLNAVTYRIFEVFFQIGAAAGLIVVRNYVDKTK
jgi:hypothetical protein